MSSLVAQRVKGPVLSLLKCRFDPWPRNFHRHSQKIKKGLGISIVAQWVKNQGRSSCCGSVVMNPNGIHEDVGSIPGVTQWVKDPALP